MDQEQANPDTGADAIEDVVAERLARSAKAPPAEDPAPRDDDASPEHDVYQEPAPDTAEPEDTQPEDDDEQDEPAETPRFTVKVDGKELEVDQQELIRGYQRLSDYTRKTQAVAAEKATIEAERQALAQERQRAAYVASQLQQHIQQEQEPPFPDPSMAESDWIGFSQQKAVYDAWAIRQMRKYEAMQQAEAFQQQHEQVEHARTVESERTRLLTVIPEWNDEAKMLAEHKNIRSYLQKVGFPDDQLNTIRDAKLMVIARDAEYGARMRKASATPPKPVPQPAARMSAPSAPGVPGRASRERIAALEQRAQAADFSMEEGIALRAARKAAR